MMGMIATLCLTVFVIGYAMITLERRWDMHKSMTAAALGAILWAIIGIAGVGDTHHTLEMLGGEIFGLFMFLLAAMTLVEILVHYQLFDWIRMRLLQLGFDDPAQAKIIGGISFFLSAIIDNLTTTITMLQIGKRFFSGFNLLVVAAIIVIAANAGGAFSPIGDITTIMLWLAKKFTEWEVIKYGFFPAVTQCAISTALLLRQIKTDTHDVEEETIVLTRSEKAVITSALCSFFLPFVAQRIGLEPYFGLLFGLGITWCLIVALRAADGHATHLEADIEGMLKKVDFASLIFFGGILLAVGALRHLGILQDISQMFFGSDPNVFRFVIGNTLLGILSAVVDNIPLTAAAISILDTHDPQIWALLALTVGTGGSLLVIGSAAGVVAMGIVKELDSFTYMRIATIPAASGYVAGIAVWCIQRMIF